MSRLIKGASALIFISGCFAILVSLMGAWVYLMILTSQVSVWGAWILLVSSIAVSIVYLEWPWKAWFQVWSWADQELDKRIAK